jgi:ABC-type transport system involved in multi-copper enzyme maturation permease subunit
MKAFVASAYRMSSIAGNTLRESLHQRFLMILASMAAMLGIVALWFCDSSIVAPHAKFLLDTGFSALTFFGSVVAIVVTAETFSCEFERRTVLAVLARPVSRGEFVLGKLAGTLVLLMVFCAVGTGSLAGWSLRPGTQSTGVLAQGFAGEGTLSPFAVMACGFVQWLRCSVLAAMTLFVATYARSSLLAVMAGFAALAICSLRALVWDAIQISSSGWGRGIAGVIGLAIPNFEFYDVADRVATGGALSPVYLAGITLYSLIYVSLFAALAIVCFRHREL